MQGHAGFLGFRAAGICRDSGMVSSVLNRDVKQFGKQHLFDGSEETCWNSDQHLRLALALPRLQDW
uniref:Nuclear receptor 2C2 associated protein n=1 Tax=Corvus moneduloides TaxID=1196302 RepID=A0A8U7NF03_CORMO